MRREKRRKKEKGKEERERKMRGFGFVRVLKTQIYTLLEFSKQSFVLRILTRVFRYSSNYGTKSNFQGSNLS